MGRGIRRIALVVLIVLAALVAPIAVPIRIVVLHLKRTQNKTELVAREQRSSPLQLPETA